MLDSGPTDNHSPALHISGAGPAGLAAAITFTRAGGKAIVHERKQTVGSRFHGDFQGQENWTSRIDMLDELADMGIQPDFPHTAFHSLIAYAPGGREFYFSSDKPLFYLVKRGSGSDSLDSALLKQALAAGVEVRFGDPVRKLPEGGICAEGPKAGDIYSRLGDGGYTRFLERLAGSRDVRVWLGQHHREQWFTRLLFPWANRMLPSKRKDDSCMHPGCSCTWCRCARGHVNDQTKQTVG